MSTSTATSPLPTRTVTARPITFGEIAALTEGTGEQRFEGFLLDKSAGTLTPATFAVFSSQGKRRACLRAVPDTRRNAEPGALRSDTDSGPCGYEVRFSATTEFGLVTAGSLFTSAEAEDSAYRLNGHSDPARFRHRVYLADESGTEMPLAPRYGAQVSVSAIVKNADADDLRARVEEVLRREFGDDLNRLVKVQTRPVKDERVDVFDTTTGQVLAVGILGAEVSLVMAGRKSAVETRPSQPGGVVVGG